MNQRRELKWDVERILRVSEEMTLSVIQMVELDSEEKVTLDRAEELYTRSRSVR